MADKNEEKPIIKKKVNIVKKGKKQDSTVQSNIVIENLTSNNGTNNETNNSNNSNNIKTFIEVCAGAGGLSTGLIKAGLKPLLLNDINKDCCKTLEKNHTEFPDCKIICDSLINLDLKNYKGAVDLLTGGVPCFISGTKVLTEKGYKNIEDVILEDKLLTHTGKFQEIINLQRKKYNGDLYDIKLKYHPENIQCTEEHPFYVREKITKYVNSRIVVSYGEPKWKKANELKINDYFGMVINTDEIIHELMIYRLINRNTNTTTNETFRLDKPEYWWMMGYFIGDGWLEEDKKNDGRLRHTIKFSINNNDEKEVSERIQKVIPIVDKKSDSGKCKKFGCHNYIWFQILQQFGKYAHSKIIPEWVQKAPKEFIKEFINGYIKADGNMTKNGIQQGTIQITTVSYNLAYGVQRLLLKLGYIFSINKSIRPKTYIIQGRTVNQRDTYQIRGKFNENRYSTFIEDNYVWYKPSKINKKQIDIENPIEVYNFEVKNDNSYIVYNTIVHNCQSYSVAGERKGLDDPRGDLMLKFVKLVETVEPKIFMIENVKGLISHNNGKTLEKVIKELSCNDKYKVVYKLLNAVNYNVPQKRERIFIIGTLKTHNINFTYPLPEQNIITVGQALRGVPVSDGAVYPEKKKKYFELIPEGGCWVNLPEDKQKEYLMSSFESGGGKRGILKRLSNTEPCLTLLCTPSQKQTERCHPTETRPLRIREYARIQTFPDTYEFVGSLSSKYKQIGNAVPVELAYRVGKELIKALETS